MHTRFLHSQFENGLLKTSLGLAVGLGAGMSSITLSLVGSGVALSQETPALAEVLLDRNGLVPTLQMSKLRPRGFNGLAGKRQRCRHAISLPPGTGSLGLDQVRFWKQSVKLWTRPPKGVCPWRSGVCCGVL